MSKYSLTKHEQNKDKLKSSLAYFSYKKAGEMM